jgi:hypothetical protein
MQNTAAVVLNFKFAVSTLPVFERGNYNDTSNDIGPTFIPRFKKSSPCACREGTWESAGIRSSHSRPRRIGRGGLKPWLPLSPRHSPLDFFCADLKKILFTQKESAVYVIGYMTEN